MKDYNNENEILEGLVAISFGVIFGIVVVLITALIKECIF